MNRASCRIGASVGVALIVATGIWILSAAHGGDPAAQRSPKSGPRVTPFAGSDTTEPASQPHPQVVEPPAGGSAVAEAPGAQSHAEHSRSLRPRPRVSLRRLVGQKIMTGMSGTYPSRSLLDRVRGGEVGGVILMGENVSSNLRAAVAALQHAAVSGGNLPLLISTDQEGGSVRRLSGAPPQPNPAEMTASTVGREGAATGAALAAVGINTDLAPVADVGQEGFIGRRSFGSNPAHVAAAACAFAAGL